MVMVSALTGAQGPACLQRDLEPWPGKRDACAPVGDREFRGGLTLTLDGGGDRRIGVGDPRTSGADTPSLGCEPRSLILKH